MAHLQPIREWGRASSRSTRTAGSCRSWTRWRLLRVLDLGPSELFHTLDLIDQRERELAADGDPARDSLFPARGLLSEATDRTFSQLAADLLDLYAKVVQDRLRPELDRLAKARKPEA
jgi:hypothetical protein